MRKMSEKDKREYDRITAHAEQMTLPLEKLTTRSKIYRLFKKTITFKN